MQNLQEVKEYALQIMNDTNFEYQSEIYNIVDEGFTFAFNNTKTSLGQANLTTRQIKLSKKVFLLNLDKPHIIKETVLHEIAHALDYLIFKNVGHSKTWKYIYKGIGGNGQRTTSDKDLVLPKGKYTNECPECFNKIESYKKPSSRICCRRCHDSGKGFIRLKTTKN